MNTLTSYLYKGSGPLSRARSRYNLLSQLPLQDRISVHKERLRICSTTWILFRRVYDSGHRDYVGIVPHCLARDCPVCLNSRINKVKRRLKPYFFSHKDPVRHITLTFGDHQPLSWAVRKKYHGFIKNFIRRLNRRSRTWGLWLYECVSKGDGLYHHHYHMAIFGRCPHHLTVTRIWKSVIGRHASTSTKYRQKKAAVLGYFARRSASAGLDKDLVTYMELIHGTRFWNRFGKMPSNLEIAEITEPKQDQFMMFFMQQFDLSSQGGSPPPDLLADTGLLDRWWSMQVEDIGA